MNINKNIHYFAKMEQFETIIPSLGIGITSGKTFWCECEVDESRYKVEEGYKITLSPIDKCFAQRHFYQTDFKNLIDEGLIIPKYKENQKVEYVEFVEMLTSTVPIIHSGYIVVD